MTLVRGTIGIGSDVGERIEQYRLAEQWDETLRHLADIDVDIEQ